MPKNPNVRAENSVPLDLTWGNPSFLSPFWDKRFVMRSGSDEGHVYGFEKPELKQAILDLHKMEDNVSFDGNPDYEVVVGNGAIQVLQAAIDAVGAIEVTAQAPYFPRFPVITRLTGKIWRTSIDYPDTEICTIPNNPNGDITNLPKLANGSTPIFDLCYNWKQYSRILFRGREDIMIFSLSKAFGFAGTRFGWALVRDKQVAQKMRWFIEQQTCGVALEAQQKACCVINDHLLGFESVMDYGRDKMEARWEIIEKEAFPKDEYNVRGMFLWTDNRTFYENLNITGLSGEEFGVGDNYYRMNVGCSDEEFKELTRRICSSR